MDAVVAGSVGFIGSHLVEALMARGYRVTGIDRQSRPDQRRDRHAVLDVADDPRRTGWWELVFGADVVFHLAATPGVRGNGPVLHEMRRRDNVLATRNLLSVTPKAIPVVAVSSSSVYGGSRDGVPSREDDPLLPRGGYARSKVDMERLCGMHRVRGGTIAVVRPFTVAGEGQRPDMAFSLWLRALRRGDPIRIFGSEDRSRDITDIRDVVEGLIRAGEEQISETVNLGSGVTHRLIDLALAVIHVFGREADIVVQPASSDEVGITLADTNHCSQLLGFVPRTDLPSLVARQFEAASPISAMAVP
jgi:nucleoside-diphosphate-sugar epimerase